MSTLTHDIDLASARESNDPAEWRAVFERLTALYGGSLRRTCRGYERDPQRQDELLQEIWLALWTALPRFEGRSSLKTWVYRVTHNTAVKHIHRQVRTPPSAEIDVEALGQQLQAIEARLKAESQEFVGRKQRKRQFRRLWVQRINAGARQHGLTYSRFINGLKKAGVDVNRKMLADLAVREPAVFEALVEKARAAL